MRAARTRQTLDMEWAASWVKCTNRKSHYRLYSHTFLWPSASSCDFFNFINFSPLFLFICCVCLTRVLPQHNAKLFLFGRLLLFVSRFGLWCCYFGFFWQTHKKEEFQRKSWTFFLLSWRLHLHLHFFEVSWRNLCGLWVNITSRLVLWHFQLHFKWVLMQI